MSVTESAFYVARLLDAAGVSRPFVNASAATKAGLGRQAGAWGALTQGSPWIPRHECRTHRLAGTPVYGPFG
jgi:hypothetical protein